MIVKVSTEGKPILEDAENFRVLSVLAICGSDQLAAALATTGRMEADGHAWILCSWLLENGRPDDAAWRAGFDAMLVYAMNHGWVDELSGRVRAHVEFAR